MQVGVMVVVRDGPEVGRVPERKDISDIMKVPWRDTFERWTFSDRVLNHARFEYQGNFHR
jgi:hypothetical protein